MVALRGKKAKATAASRKAIEKAAVKQKAAASAAAAAFEETTAAMETATEMSPDEKLQRLVAFATRAGLALHASTLGDDNEARVLAQKTADMGIAPFLDAMLVAQCASAKDKNAEPNQILSRLTSASRKRVCGVIFSADEIAYSCRNCQVDSTCVICKDCFMHGDHSGHDVYFQRTTAGSSCDCGDYHAWKRSGFCARHPGAEEDQSVSRKDSLPKPLQSIAPVVIESVVDFIHQVFLGIDQGFEFAEAVEVFTRDIPPFVLSEIATPNSSLATASPSHIAPVPVQVDNRRRPRQTGTRRATPTVETSAAVPTTPPPKPQQLAIRLHNDDVHTLGDVINALCTALDCGKRQARATVSDADRNGDSVVANLDILKCIAPVGTLVRGSLNISVAPVWWEKHMERSSSIFEWLRSISMASDGLYEIVSGCLRKRRGRQLESPEGVSFIFAEGVSITAFLKEHRLRVHSATLDILEDVTKCGAGDLKTWSTRVESAFDEMFWFEDSNTVGTHPLRHAQQCENLLITELMKSLSLTRAYGRHQSVRDGCAAVAKRFFVPRDGKAPASLLALMVRWDCALRKRTAHLGHALLREHMLNKTFRKCMLEAYANSYGAMTASYLKGLGTSPESIFDFAVQFLTVPQLVREYTRAEVENDPRKPQLAFEILAATERVLTSAVKNPSGQSTSSEPFLDVDHPALSSQKYKHCIDDLEYIFNVGAMPNELVCDDRNLALWVASLKVLQNGDLQTRRGIHQSHVEYESDSWLSMFNLGIRIHSIFPVSWNGITPETLANRKQMVKRISQFVVNAILDSSQAINCKVEVKKIKPIQSLRENNTIVERTYNVYDFNVSTSPTSLHVPLHRFLAASIRHVSIHVTWLQDVLEPDGLISTFALDTLTIDQRVEMLELPLRSLVMASQIQSSLWRRNGEENMMAQLYNYSALPYCVHYRDADVFLLQVGVLLLGPDALLTLMIDRFQIGDFFVDGVPAMGDMGYTPREVGVDDQQQLQMVEEFLRLIIVLGTSLPSATGEENESLFMEDEMVQHLCAKPSSFSKLFDVAMLPTGQDDVSVTKLEEVLSRVADFTPPSGLEPGRYELKEGLLESYNPYFLHLNREAHELARDRWTTYRKVQRQKNCAASSNCTTFTPLQRMRRPLSFLKTVRGALTSEATVTIVHVVLWKLARDALSDKGKGSPNPGSSISDAVISTTLHLLVYGIYAAEEFEDGRDAFWASLCSTAEKMSGSSVISLLWSLSPGDSSSHSVLDDDQMTTLQWLLAKIGDCSELCATQLNQLKHERHVLASRQKHHNSGGSANSASSDPIITLEQRKDEARKRALEAMARQQAAFQAMMDNMDDDDDGDEHGESEIQLPDCGETDTTEDASVLGKRRGSVEAEKAGTDLQKRPRLSDVTGEETRTCFKCILCHDTSNQGEMGVAAYVHQSTVLTGSFRPEPEEAISSRGAEVRKQVKALIEKMDLCSGGPSVSTNSHSPALRALAAQFPDWYMDDGGFDEEMVLDPPVHNLNSVGTQRQIRHASLPTDHSPREQRRRPAIEAFLMNEDEDLDMLEGVLDLREDQRLFPLSILGGTGLGPERRDRGTLRPPDMDAGIIVARRGGHSGDEDSDFDDDSDDFEDDDRHNHHHHHHNHHHPRHNHRNHRHQNQSPRRPRSGARTESVPLHLTPCGLHIRTCQHAVHIHCLERYIRSLHEKAIRGEDFDGVQAIDPDAAMTQFLCPLCKTLCNFLIPTSDPAGSRPGPPRLSEGDDDSSVSICGPWYQVVERQLKVPGWYRAVLGRDGDFSESENDVHDLWRDYFEETLWEPHGSLEKGAPYLWSACAFSIASFLNVAEDETQALGSSASFNPLTDTYPPSLEKEFTSLVAVTKFCRWSFSLLEHSEDAKVIWETSKRCNPIHTETKREYRKFTKVLGSIDACLRGTILGLLVADTFTAFVISSVIADSYETIWSFIPAFSAADLLQRVHAEFFVQSKDERSLLQDKDTIEEEVEVSGEVTGTEAFVERSGRQTRSSSRAAESRNVKSSTTALPASKNTAKSSRKVVQEMIKNRNDLESEEYALLMLLGRIIDAEPDETLKPLTKKDVTTRLKRIKMFNSLFVRRMQLFWRCLVDSDLCAYQPITGMVCPSLGEVADSPTPVFSQIWKWCVDRMNSKSFLATTKSGDMCEHAEGCGEGYIASMFILRDQVQKPRLVELPVQYDELYGMMSGRKCARCDKTPCDPGICLICGEFLCCGDSCCSHPYVNHGPQVGECTRHAAECGGGIGIVLMLDQCRVAVVGGSMAAHFPCPYVDSHGEEDVGLQRGRPLRLDMARYRYLESLWLNHRIFAEVSRQRNQREPQFTINLSYL